MDKSDFDKWAVNYDQSVTSSIDKFPFLGYFDVLKEVCHLAEGPDEMQVVDVGIGTGLLSAYLSKIGYHIYGLDFSEAMIQKAKSRIPEGEFDVTNVIDNHLGRFSRMRFDRIISSYWFHHLDNGQKIEFLKRSIDNNLSANGRVIIADIGFSNMDDLKSARIKYADLWDNEESYICADKLLRSLADIGFNFEYLQISECAGLMIYISDC